MSRASNEAPTDTHRTLRRLTGPANRFFPIANAADTHAFTSFDGGFIWDDITAGVFLAGGIFVESSSYIRLTQLTEEPSMKG